MAAAELSPLRWESGELWLLDQRVLPTQEAWRRCQTVAEVATAIAEMVVRGAPAIGLAGAFGMVLARKTGVPAAQAAQQLRAARPTAVHLAWAVEEMQASELKSAEQALCRAQALYADDAAINRRMAEHGAALLPAACRVLTHCNTGALATAGWGTALGVIRVAHRQGRLLEVLVSETRPWLQGARLTAWELQAEGIPLRLIADGAAPWAMQTMRPDWIIVGADRIAANGDVANKIGTYALAQAARVHGLKMMVVAPLATIDWTLRSGQGIPIEERPAQELCTVQGQRVAPENTAVWNPVFDVTPAHLVDALVTEQGVIRCPDQRKLLAWRKRA